jgi:alanyl-tRNA synthetase
VPVVVANFCDAFPELTARMEFVQLVVADEETSFNRTLDQGVRHFKKVVASMESAGVKVVPAKDAHILFSSMGFPLDLTELMAAERDLTVDRVGFEELMENDRKISEAAEQSRKNTGSRDMTMEAEQTAWLQTRAVPITDSDLKYSWDVAPVAQVQAVFLGRGGQTAGFVESASVEEGLVGVVLNQTSFYYESGGQIFDTGVLESLDGTFRLNVLNSQSYAGYVVHVGTLDATSSAIQVGASVSVKVDYERRGYVAPNHTMTHVLNYALKTVLMGPSKEGGDSSDALSLCDQKGSLVDADRLRFDFSWTSALTAAQTSQVEQLVNEKIRAGLPVFAQVVPLSSATQISSLRKVFGERYPDPVRVISVGADVEALIAQPNNPEWHGLSIEFCGGTHLTNTSQAEDFVITEESGIAKGIRRISGLTRLGARQARARNADLADRIAQMAMLGGGEELVAQFKLVKIEVDQAVISLVDKEALRLRLTAIYETIKAYYKVSLARKVAEASVLAEEAAKAAATSNQVRE